MDDIATDSSDQRRKLRVAGQLDDFQNLEKGVIDIFEYISAEADSFGSSDTLVAEENKSNNNNNNNKMESNNSGLGGLNHHNGHLPPNYLSRNGNLAAAAMLQRGLGGNNGGQLPANNFQRITTTRHAYMPESPPETDSGAASAGSPSGSEASPCSPDYHNYPGISLQQQNTVIVPSAGIISPEKYNGAMPPYSQQSVILNPQRLNVNGDYNGGSSGLPNGQHMTTAHLNGLNLGGADQMQHNVFYGNMGNNVQQISPPHHNGSYAQYSNVAPSIFQQSDIVPRKRPRAENNQFVKHEPSSPPVVSISDENMYPEETSHQSIQFNDFDKDEWCPMYSSTENAYKPITNMRVTVLADKGFNFITFDTAFVNQKKSHFQVSIELRQGDGCVPEFVKTKNSLERILKFELDFFGVKAELPSHQITIKQSATDRKPVEFKPMEICLDELQQHLNSPLKRTAARLHFSETTNNNQRKNGKPNADQKYFWLIMSLNAVTLNAFTTDSGEKREKLERRRVMAYASDKVIVRASNPGQFDNGDSEVHWQRAQQSNAVYHMGPVCVNTDKAAGTLTVAGDIHCAGVVTHPSDIRLKENIIPIDGLGAVENMKKIEFYTYDIKPSVAEEFGLPEDERTNKVGVIAQELQKIIPDAVKDTGDYLTVVNDRFFMENAVAVKELCFLTGHMENRMSEVEKFNKKVAKVTRLDSIKSAISNMSLNKAGSFCSSYISCSRSTVDRPVAGKSKDKKTDTHEKGDENRNKSKKDYYYHYHQTCRRFANNSDDGGLCNNRVIHSTVIILLTVMAFCLLAMAALYFLDWYGRHTWGLPYPAMFSHDKAGGKGRGSDAAINTTPPSGGKAGSKSAADDIGKMQVTLPSSTSFFTEKVPAGLPPPLHPCNHLRCEQYCCDHARSIYDLKGLKNEHLIFIARNAGSVGQRYRAARQASWDVSANKDLSQNKKLLYEIVEPPTTTISAARSFNSTKIRILGSDNITLDRRYCLDDCNDLKRGNLTFYVPISPYMPHMPVNVKFDIGFDDHAVFCGKTVGPVCFGLGSFDNRRNLDHVQQRALDTWELPVGLYVDSYYTFRIGSSTTLCSMPNDEAGASFIEFTLWFYRSCN